MTQITFRGNMQSMTFPLLSTQSSATVIDSRADHTYVPRVNAEGNIPADRGLPGAFFCENIMPSTYGWQSVGYKSLIPALSGGFQITRVVLVKGARVSEAPPEEGETEGEVVITPTGNQTLLGIANLSGSYKIVAIDKDTNVWKDVAVGELELVPTSELFVATLNGSTFIYVSNIGCYVYDDITNTLVLVELLSLDPEELVGIAAANGYMIAWSTSAISWSSVINVLDFEPSDVTGAGGGQLQEATGDIVCAVPTSLGFLVYTTSNIVSALYTGNEAYPFSFKALASSGGITDVSQVTEEQSTSAQYAYTSNGLQQVSHQRCQTTMPHITDFLESRYLEYFDFEQNEIVEEILSAPVTKILAIVSDRYLVISYGKRNGSNKSQAVVIDTAQTRMGKLKFDHVQVFELAQIGTALRETPRGSIALLVGDGSIYSVNFDEMEDKAEAVLYLGKYQITRSNGIEIQEIYLSNTQLGANFELLIKPSLDSKNLLNPIVPFLYQDHKDLKHYLVDGPAAFNQSVILKGTFNVMDFRLVFNIHGMI